MTTKRTKPNVRLFNISHVISYYIMTAKEFVQEKYPKARSERQVKNSGEAYYLIRNRGETMYMASGNSESNAWVNTKKWILDKP